MTAQPLVTVLTPVYNGAEYLREALDSVASQDYANFEYVIVDNCSDDATPAIAAEFAARDPRVRIVRNPHLVGVIENHNIAFREISGESAYCKVLHADDRLEPGCLRAMVATGERHPLAGIIGAYSYWGDRVFPESIPADRALYPGPELCRRVLLGRFYPFLSPTSLMLRSEVIRTRDPFYQGSDLHADLAAYYEVLAHWDFAFVGEPLTMVRDHSDSLTSAQARPMNKLLASRLYMLTTYGPRYLETADYERMLERRLGRYYRYLARNLLARRERAFWTTHRDALADAGQPLDPWRLLYTVASRIIRRPRESIRTFVQGFGGDSHVRS
jgi:glycosyltransferase involved in cell wall biosynthesis